MTFTTAPLRQIRESGLIWANVLNLHVRRSEPYASLGHLILLIGLPGVQAQWLNYRDSRNAPHQKRWAEPFRTHAAHCQWPNRIFPAYGSPRELR